MDRATAPRQRTRLDTVERCLVNLDVDPDLYTMVPVLPERARMTNRELEELACAVPASLRWLGRWANGGVGGTGKPGEFTVLLTKRKSS